MATAAPRPGGGGALRPRHGRAFPPRHQARALAAGQGAHAVHVRSVAARRDPPGIAVNRERSPGASLEDRRFKRDERRAKQREQTIVRADAMHRARLAVDQRHRTGIQCWLLRMVLLALARRLLPAGLVAQHLVRPLPGSLQDGGAERALLFLANGGNRYVMAQAMQRQALCLHRQSQRIAHAHPALRGNRAPGS